MGRRSHGGARSSYHTGAAWGGSPSLPSQSSGWLWRDGGGHMLTPYILRLVKAAQYIPHAARLHVGDAAGTQPGTWDGSKLMGGWNLRRGVVVLRLVLPWGGRRPPAGRTGCRCRELAFKRPRGIVRPAIRRRAWGERQPHPRPRASAVSPLHVPRIVLSRRRKPLISFTPFHPPSFPTPRPSAIVTLERFC